ncbi:MAG TPA: 50S ribosomal protein L30, partial [Treponemataceae bacterium]|nr:50S ribosomal protein L30 [Treponemataceae bacterium]
TIGQKPAKCATVRCLGLKKINSSVEHDINPCVMGMIASVSHLVKYEEMN